jgi:hypothetical protein
MRTKRRRKTSPDRHDAIDHNLPLRARSVGCQANGRMRGGLTSRLSGAGLAAWFSVLLSEFHKIAIAEVQFMVLLGTM